MFFVFRVVKSSAYLLQQPDFLLLFYRLEFAISLAVDFSCVILLIHSALCLFYHVRSYSSFSVYFNFEWHVSAKSHDKQGSSFAFFGRLSVKDCNKSYKTTRNNMFL